MVRRRVAHVLADVLDAIAGVETHTAGKTLQDFQRDWLLKFAVQRALEIISEAARNIPESLLTEVPDVPWKQIRGIGNMLRHEYHKIADDVVWAVVTEHLAPLKQAILLIQNLNDQD